MTVPKPWHAAHGREVMTWPRKLRVTCWTSPRPRQTSQVRGEVPGRVPAPLQVGQATAVSTWRSRVDAEGRLGQVELDPDQGVLATALPRARTAAHRRLRRRRRRP